MAATGKTPILLYGSTTATNAPVAGNLTNSSDGCEIAINVADKNLFFKDSTNAVNTVPIRQSSGSSDGWLSSTNWTTFNSKQAAYTNLTSIGSLANATGWLYNNGSGTFSYSTPSASDVGAVPTSRTVSTTSPLAGGGALSSNLTLSITQATTSTNGYLSSTDWNTFNNKAAAFTYTTNYIPFGQGTTTPLQSAALTFDAVTFSVGTTSIANAKISLLASASSDANEPEFNFYSAVFANLNKPKIKSANGTLALLVESGSTSTFQKRARLRLDGGGAATATIQTSTNNGSAFTDQLTIAGATGDVTVNTGNLVIGTSGKGIDFSATAGTGTSELLADYEEGTWTPTVTAQSGSITTYTATGRYTLTGRVVVAQFNITLTTVGTAGGGCVFTLPFTNGAFVSVGVGREDALTGQMQQVRLAASATTAVIFKYDNASPFLYGNGAVITGEITYSV